MRTNIEVKLGDHVIAYVGLDEEKALAAVTAFRTIHAEIGCTRTPVTGSEKQVIWHYTVIAYGRPQAELEKVGKEINDATAQG